jgi:hypothetical protein
LLAVNEGGHGQYFVQSFAADPLRAEGVAASLRPDDIAADGRTIVGNGARSFGGVTVELEARFALLLPPALRGLPPVPIYGRAPDAKPVQSRVEGPKA